MLVAMIICDQIIIEEGTHKKSIVGCFNSISAQSFPCAHPTFFIFIALTNGRGSVKTKLKCHNEDENLTVFEAGGSLTFKDPLQTIEIGFRLVNLTFPKPGTHAIEFWCEDELLLVRKIKVIQVPNVPTEEIT